MFGIEKDFQNLMEQVYGPLGEKPQMTEIQQLKEDIAILQEKLQKLEELEKTKSPVEEAYNEWYGEYPPTSPDADKRDIARWHGFQAGYEVAFAISTAKEVKEEVIRESEENKNKDALEWPTTPKPFMNNCIITGNPPNGYSSWSDWYNELGSKGILVNLRISSNECKPTLKSPEETEQSLKEAFREADKQGAVSSTKSKTLTNLIERWWCDVFTTHSDWDMETSIDDLVDRIQLWLPKEQFANSQNEYVELTVEGFNDCVNKIKDNLR